MKNNRSLILASIHFSDDKKIYYKDKSKLCDSIGISTGTLEHHFEYLSTNEYISRKKEYGNRYIELSKKGVNELFNFIDRISNLYYNESQHGVDKPIRVFDLISIFDDPFYQVFLLRLYLKKKKHNVYNMIDAHSTIKSKEHAYGFIRNIFDKDNDPINLESAYMRLSSHSLLDKKPDEIDRCIRFNIYGCLIYADISIRSGEFNTANQVFSAILDRTNIPQNVRLLCELGKCRITFFKGKKTEAIRQLDHLYKNYRNKYIRYLLKQYKADWLGTFGEIEESQQLFLFLIKELERNEDMNMVLCMCYINIGVTYFKEEKIQTAYEYWIKARHLSQQLQLHYYETIIITNIASVFRKQGRYDQAINLLESANHSYSKLSLLELKYHINYNICLLEISKGEFENGLEFFNESFNPKVKYPPHYIMKERMKHVISTLKEMKAPKETIDHYRSLYN